MNICDYKQFFRHANSLSNKAMVPALIGPSSDLTFSLQIVVI